MSSRKPIPATQKQLSQESTGANNFVDNNPVPENKRRENQRSVKGDDTKQFSIGLKDIDEGILFYFNEVIRPRVSQNGKIIPVPVLYGSPERWKSVQQDGHYRDKNGKLQAPLIMFKRESIDKIRTAGNKLDANAPNNYGVFKKKYSTKNIYDKFSLLNNRNEVDEFYGVIVPDFVKITYECIVFTDYVDQMNKIVEAINFASDSYWGNPERFQFRASIETYQTSTEVTQGSDRTVKTSFTITLHGHIIPDTINAQINGMNKFYSKSAVIFGMEATSNINEMNRYSNQRKSSTRTRFYDQPPGAINLITLEESMTPEQKEYVSLQRIYTSNTVQVVVDPVANTLLWTLITIATPPTGFPALSKANFQIFINGMIIETDAIDEVIQVGTDVRVTFNNTVGFALGENDEYTIVGKFIS